MTRKIAARNETIKYLNPETFVPQMSMITHKLFFKVVSYLCSNYLESKSNRIKTKAIHIMKLLNKGIATGPFAWNPNVPLVNGKTIRTFGDNILG